MITLKNGWNKNVKDLNLTLVRFWNFAVKYPLLDFYAFHIERKYNF